MIIGRARLNGQIRREVVGIFAAAKAAKPGVVTEADIAGLPEPVQRWLKYSGIIGKERVAAVRLLQQGEFRLSPTGGWLPFTAEEYYTTDPPAFLWKARVRVAPFIWLAGRDRYEGGRGQLRFKLGWLIPMVKAQGKEVDQGALLRYLNETMWFPSAALCDYLAWEGIDSSSARATMSYQGVTASAVFHFDREGRLTDMNAARYMDNSLENWATPITGYGELQGLRIPVAGTGVWHLKAGDFRYIRVRLTAIDYNRPVAY
jgi:hypothetical protein